MFFTKDELETIEKQLMSMKGNGIEKDQVIKDLTPFIENLTDEPVSKIKSMVNSLPEDETYFIFNDTTKRGEMITITGDKIINGMTNSFIQFIINDGNVTFYEN